MYGTYVCMRGVCDIYYIVWYSINRSLYSVIFRYHFPWHITTYIRTLPHPLPHPITPTFSLLISDEVCGHEKEIREVNKGIESLHKDTVKLNALITHKRGEEESLQQGNVLVEGDFVATLKVRT